MSLSSKPERTESRRRRLTGTVALAGALCLWSLGQVTWAHEHKHTHQNLARAAFRLLDTDTPFFQNVPLGGLTEQDIEDELAQGVIDEDECLEFDSTGSNHNWGNETNWNSHFYEAKRGTKLSINVLVGTGDCERIRFGTHTNAADRARTLYGMAVTDYHAGRFRSAFRILGRVLHLVEDMTSPPHVHDDPHGELFSDCGGDSDDFERWGYCGGLAQETAGKNTHVCEYFYDPDHTHHPIEDPIQFINCVRPPSAECHADFDNDGQAESYGVPPAGFQCQLWAALQILYGGRPQGNRLSDDPVTIRPRENIGFAFVRHVADITYDFTTFKVHLEDVSSLNDPQPNSELKRMLRGSTRDDCNNILPANDKGLCEQAGAGYRIRGDMQDVGQTAAEKGSIEKAWPDTSEEWWLMPTSYDKTIKITPRGGIDVFINGFAYIENAGGEGPAGLGEQDSFIPLRYEKALAQRLYSTPLNGAKTMLRIYGDVLYSTAAAYGAGLIQAFIDEVTVPPVAVPGGPYQGEACTPINFDASGSHDPNGTITLYEWDFTNDGTFDAASPDALFPYAYPSVFDGLARLRVTDNEGFIDEATTDVVVTPDVTAPVINEIRATPNTLWAPNHKLRRVTIDVSVADACGDSMCRIIGVTSSEPGDGRGANGTEPDWMVVDDLAVQLRAERSGGAEQRVYTVTLSCIDAAGNESIGDVTVTVPHDQRR